MDALDSQLAALIEEALQECQAVSLQANQQGVQWLSDSANESIVAMRNYLKSARSGALPRPSAGAGLGFSRALGEWAVDQERLMALAYEVDRFYGQQCNCEREGK